MQQHKYYFYVISAVFIGQCSLTGLFLYDSKLTQEKISKLEAELKPHISNSRKIASIPVPKLIENKIPVTNYDNKAELAFNKINSVCNVKLKSDCLSQIDHMITQYPESNWTARSLLLLSHYYFNQNRQAEARSLIRIIKSEFKAYNDFAYDIKKINSQKL